VKVKRVIGGLVGLVCLVSRAGWAQAPEEPPPHYQADFPPEEFKARWDRVYDAIGDQAAALIQGAPMVRGFVLPRQANEFYYLCSVETPHSHLLLDARTRKATLFLPARNARLERSEGRVLAAADVDLAKSLTGVADVLSTMIVVTETGYTNFTDFLPTEIEAIEKEVKKGGLLQRVPPPLLTKLHDIERIE
jgi:Aminopeptidase P, N-terminal domain